MTEMYGSLREAPCARGGADYKGRANSFKRGFDDRYFSTTSTTPRRCPLVAALHRRADRDHGAGRWRHASHRIRTFDCRVETGHRHAAAAQSGAVDAGVRRLQDHSAISRTQCRHESRRIQDDFLVGMEPPAARARDRACLSAAVSLVPVARGVECRHQTAALDDLWPRRAARRGRLVDGGFRALATGGSFALSSRHSSGARAVHFRKHRLDACAD